MKLIKKYSSELFFFLAYFFITIIYTFPLFFKISEVIWGYVGDNFGAIWEAWWLRYARENNLSPSFTPLNNFPFGREIDITGSILEPLWQVPLYSLSNLFGEIAVFNAIIFASFPLSGITAYFLAKHISKNRPASFVAGLIYMLAPYHFWQSFVHISLALYQWLPLFLLFLIKTDESPRFKNAFFLGVSFSLIFLTSLYQGYFAILLALSFLVIKIIYRFIKERTFYLNLTRLKVYLLAVFVSLALIFPTGFQFYQGKKAEGSNPIETHVRSLEELLSLSLRPWDLLIPPPDHPVFGKYELPIHLKIRSLTNDYKSISAFLPERVIYFGWITFIFTLVGVFLGWKRKVSREFIVVTLGTLLLIFLISLPPFVYVKGVKVLLPSYFLYQILPVFRVYARLGSIILLLVIPLLALGLSFWLGKFKGAGKIIISTLVSGVILFEFLNFPPFHVSDFGKIPQSYKWLSEQPGSFGIIEYPRTYDVPDSLIYQRIHKKPIFNPVGEGRETKYWVLWPLLENLGSPISGSVLSSLGVKYAVVHTEVPYDKRNPFDELSFTRVVSESFVTPLRAGGDQFKVVQEFKDAVIVEIIQKPDKLLINHQNKITIVPKEDKWEWGNKINTFTLANADHSDIKLDLTFKFFDINPKMVRTYLNEQLVTTKENYSLVLKPGSSVLKFEILEKEIKGGIKDINIQTKQITEVKQ